MTGGSFRFGLFLVGFACCCGCVSKQAGVEVETLTWRTGETTRRDVVEKWGNPDAIKGDVWVWRDCRQVGGKVKAGYFGLGLTVDNRVASTCEYRLRFDKSGRLASTEVVESVPGGGKWSINPWD